jgi:hypothetical protein
LKNTEVPSSTFLSTFSRGVHKSYVHIDLQKNGLANLFQAHLVTLPTTTKRWIIRKLFQLGSKKVLSGILSTGK